MEYFADRAEPSNWPYNKSSEAFWTSCFWFSSGSNLPYGNAQESLHCKKCWHYARRTGYCVFTILIATFFCHTCASQWRRLHQPASPLYFDFRASALVFLELSCGHLAYFPSYTVLFLEQLVYHTFAAWWRRFYQPASWMLYIDFSAWALVSFNLPSGPWVSFPPKWLCIWLEYARLQ